jgi:hypothetical protein
MMASFGSPLKLTPSPKRRKETLNWEQCIICQCSNAEPVICMRDVGKDSFVRSMEVKRDEVYSLILQEMSTLDNFISRKIKVVYHRNCWTSFNYVTNKCCSTNPFSGIFVSFVNIKHSRKILKYIQLHPVSVWTSWWSVHWVKMMIRLSGSRVQLWRFCSERSLS